MSEADSKRIFQARFNELLEKEHIAQKDIAKICGVSTSTVSTWSQGLNMPRMDKIEKLAAYFGLTKSYFIEEEKPLVNNDEELTEYLEELKNRPELKMLFRLTKKATKEDVEKAVKIIEAYLDES